MRPRWQRLRSSTPACISYKKSCLTANRRTSKYALPGLHTSKKLPSWSRLLRNRHRRWYYAEEPSCATGPTFPRKLSSSIDTWSSLGPRSSITDAGLVRMSLFSASLSTRSRRLAGSILLIRVRLVWSCASETCRWWPSKNVSAKPRFASKWSWRATTRVYTCSTTSAKPSQSNEFTRRSPLCQSFD